MTVYEHEFRLLIKHYVLCKEPSPKPRTDRLYKYYGDSAPSTSIVKKWFTEFRCGRTSTSDVERSGRPKEVVTLEIANKIAWNDIGRRRIKVREMAEWVGMSSLRVHNI